MRFGIRPTKTRSRKERFALVLLGFVTLADAMVVILSLGFVCADWRADLLFSEWYDQFCQ